MFTKGKHHNKKWLVAMRSSKHREIQRKNALRLGLKPPSALGNKVNIGRKHSEKTRRKMSKKRKGNKCYLWRGGINPKNLKIRGGIDFRLWREAAFARDNWTCQKCNKRGNKLHPHHIKNFSQYPELRFAIDNGITLCKEHHKKFHKIYGYKNNNQEQIKEYLGI